MKIKAPEFCPSCSSKLQWRNDLLYCENLSCSGKEAKRIEHFCKSLKIKGLGPATISKLNLQSILDIYELTSDSIASLLGSEKMAVKIYKEIESSKKAALEEVLPAFSVPLVGKTVSEKLCSHLMDLEEITEEVCLKAGLGPKATNNLLTWVNSGEYKLFPFSFKASSGQKQIKGVVCITGKLKSVKTKGEAEKLLVEAGYRVKPSVTKEVTILLNESGTESAKTKKARDNGVSVINNLNQLIEV